MENYPAIPRPSYTFSGSVGAGVLRSTMESGLKRQVVQFPTLEHSFAVKWTLTGAEFDLFKAWFETDLDSGTLYWSLPVPFGEEVPADPNDGLPVRFVEARYTSAYRDFDTWDVSATVEQEIAQTLSDPGPSPVPVWWRDELTVVGDDALDAGNDDAEIHAAPPSGTYWTLTVPDTGEFTFGINLTGLGGVLLVKEGGDAGIGAPPPAPVSIFEKLEDDLQAQLCTGVFVFGVYSHLKADNAGTVTFYPGLLPKSIANAGTAGGRQTYLDATSLGAQPHVTGFSLDKFTSTAQSITYSSQACPVGLVGTVDRLYGFVFNARQVNTSTADQNFFWHGNQNLTANAYCGMDLVDLNTVGNLAEATLRMGSPWNGGSYDSARRAFKTGNYQGNGWHYVVGQYTASSGIFKIWVDGVAGTDSTTPVTLHNTNTTDLFMIAGSRGTQNGGDFTGMQIAASFVTGDLTKKSALEALLAAFAAKLNAQEYWT